MRRLSDNAVMKIFREAKTEKTENIKTSRNHARYAHFSFDSQARLNLILVMLQKHKKTKRQEAFCAFLSPVFKNISRQEIRGKKY